MRCYKNARVPEYLKPVYYKNVDDLMKVQDECEFQLVNDEDEEK